MSESTSLSVTQSWPWISQFKFHWWVQQSQPSFKAPGNLSIKLVIVLAVINIRWMRLPSCQWPKVGLGIAIYIYIYIYIYIHLLIFLRQNELKRHIIKTLGRVLHTLSQNKKQILSRQVYVLKEMRRCLLSKTE